MSELLADDFKATKNSSPAQKAIFCRELSIHRKYKAMTAERIASRRPRTKPKSLGKPSPLRNSTSADEVAAQNTIQRATALASKVTTQLVVGAAQRDTKRPRMDGTTTFCPIQFPQ